MQGKSDDIRIELENLKKLIEGNGEVEEITEILEVPSIVGITIKEAEKTFKKMQIREVILNVERL